MRLVADTCTQPPHQRPVRPRAMAEAEGSERRIWQAHYCSRIACGLSSARAMIAGLGAKRTSSVPMSLSRPHAVMFSIDDESQIQTLDRTQSGLPLKPGRCAARVNPRLQSTGTTALLATLSVLTRRRHRRFDATP